MLNFLNSRFEEILGAFLLGLMACISFINVIVRYCTNFSFSASEELTVNFFVWIVLLGTARAFREGSNFCMNLLYLGSIEVWDEFSLNVSSESLDIPVWLYTMATPLFSLLIIVRIIQKVISDFKSGLV